MRTFVSVVNPAEELDVSGGGSAAFTKRGDVIELKLKSRGAPFAMGTYVLALSGSSAEDESFYVSRNVAGVPVSGALCCGVGVGYPVG